MSSDYSKDIVAEAVKEQALGSMGVRTGGSVANELGYQQWERQQETSRGSWGSGAGSGSGTGSGGGLLSLIFIGGLLYGGFWVYEQTQSWWVVGAAGVALFAVIYGLIRFFTSEIGQMITAILFGIAIVVGFGYLMNGTKGIHGVLWSAAFVAAGGALFGLSVAWGMFVKSAFGRTVIGVFRVAFLLAILGGIGWFIVDVGMLD